MKKILIPLLMIICSTAVAQNGFTYYPQPSGYTATFLRYKNAVEPDNNGNVWVAFERVGLGKFNIASQTWTMYDSTNSGLPAGVVRSLAIDGNGNIWAGTVKGLAKFDNTNWTLFVPSNSSIPDTFINALKVSGADLIIGTNKGFSIMNGSNFTNYSTLNSNIVNDTVKCIEKSSGVDIFLGTVNGLSRFDGFNFTNFTTSNSWLAENSISFLKYSSTGTLWISSVNSICKLSGNTIASVPKCNYNYKTNYYWVSPGSIETDNSGRVITLYFQKALRMSENFKVEELSLPYTNYQQAHRVKYDASGKLWIVKSNIGGTGFASFDSSQSSGFTIVDKGSSFLDINEVGALVHNRGDMFWDLAGNAKYEIPKCSGKNAAFASALWMGGIDNNGNLLTAAMTYRQNGVDYWPGPLDTTNGAFDSVAAAPYDRIWKVNRFAVEDFKYHFLNGSVTNGTWAVPEEIITWPAQGTGNLSRNLAPFVDFNSDGAYNPYDGDYPLIKGDQMLYFIFNDNGGIKTETNSPPFGFEIHGSAYAFTCPSLPDSEQVLNYTTFYDFKIINRSFASYDSTFVGIFDDFDLGFYNDDYAGCDSVLNASFVYNGDNVDDLPDGYGLNPPMINNLILKGPLPPPNDGIDNDHDGTIDEPGEINMMSSFISFINDNTPPNGNPSGMADIYNYLGATWRDGTPLTYGGNGYNPGSTNYTEFMFSGLPYAGTGWTAITAGIIPSDQRNLTSSGPFSINPGEWRELEYAVVYTRDSLNANGLNTSIARNTHDLQKIKYWYDNNNFPSCLPIILTVEENTGENTFEIFPNPVKEELTVNGHWSSGEKVELKVFDLYGRMVFEVQPVTSPIKLETSSYAPGMYLITIKDISGISVKKFVKE